MRRDKLCMLMPVLYATVYMYVRVRTKSHNPRAHFSDAGYLRIKCVLDSAQAS